MSSDSTPHPPNKTLTQESKSSESAAGYAPYPKLEQEDAAPVADTWTATTAASSTSTTAPAASNPYVSSDPVAPSPIKNNVEKVKGVLGKWGKQAAEATKKAEDLAGNMWQHLKTGPSMADAAVGSIARSTKVLAEGGHEKVFQKTFENAPEEKLVKYYGCYLSTSAGPVAGVIYLSTEKVAFCSDDPLQYKASESEEPHYSYYKVVIPLHQLKAVNASTSKVNSAEKYIQIISVDNHEFWFMGFVYYDSAVKNLQGALQAHQL